MMILVTWCPKYMCWCGGMKELNKEDSKEEVFVIGPLLRWGIFPSGKVIKGGWYIQFVS